MLWTSSLRVTNYSGSFAETFLPAYKSEFITVPITLIAEPGAICQHISQKNLDNSPSHTPPAIYAGTPVDGEYSQSIASLDHDQQFQDFDHNREAQDVHSHFPVSEGLYSFYGNFAREQGLKQDLNSLGLTSDNVNSSEEFCLGRRY